MNPLIASRLSAGVREADKNYKLREKHGECKCCGGRSFLGDYETGYDCPACKGTGAELPKEDEK